MNPNPITASRIKMLRIERGESQQQFAENFSEFMGRATVISVMTVSCWESGRKLPPFDTMLWIQKYYGCSLDYLAGISNVREVDGDIEKAKSENEKSPQADIRTNIEIPFRDLSEYDGQPVYVEFPTNQYRDRWGIVNFANKTIRFADLDMEINSKCRYFEYITPEAVTIRSLAHHQLNLKDVMLLDRVWIESLSRDPVVKGEITGWYKHSPDKTFLYNEKGFTLSYEGLGVGYNAINFKSTRKAN